MSEDHQKRAIEWYLYLHSEQPLPPAKLMAPSFTAQASAPMKASGTAKAGQDDHDAPGIYTRFVL